jgi:uncharacterized membrane protein
MDVWIIGIPIVGLAIVAIAAYMLWRITRSRRTGELLKDERTEKITGRAFRVGFTVGSLYLIALNFYNIINIQLLGGGQLESMPVINSTLIVMSVAVLVAGAIFNRREDF